ncbi:uncharacterized protein CBL_14622 [Carabus blaptoides fortunei]
MVELVNLFENPLNLPVEKLYLKVKRLNSKYLEVKAIDKYWVKQLYYPCYLSVPTTEENVVKWMNMAENYIKSLQFLRSLSFHKFWSYLFFEEQVAELLESFLREAPACYMPQPNKQFEEHYNKIYRLIFSIYKRIITPMESEDKFITPAYLGKMLYDNRIITNAILWDLARIFGYSNGENLAGMIKLILEIAPELVKELEVSLSCFNNIFVAVTNAAYECDNLNERQLSNITGLLYDTAVSINMFLRLSPTFVQICINEKFYNKIIHMYDAELPNLYSTLYHVLPTNDHTAFGELDKSRIEFLESCHRLCSYCLDIMLQSQTETIDQQNTWIDKYLDIIESSLSQKVFLIDFDAVYPISQDIEILSAICTNIDHTRFNNITKMLTEAKMKETNNHINEDTDIPAEAYNYEDIIVPEDVMLESKISEVKEVFPDLGEGFIERCLVSYDLDSQQVTMAILEDNLPPEIAELDRSLPRIPPETEHEFEPTPGTSAQDSVTFGFIGKKPSEYKDLADMLNDKLHVKEQKKRFTNYSLLPEEQDMYDDDYDDSNNGPVFLVMDRDTDDMQNLLPNRNRSGRRADAEPSDQEDEDEDTEETTSVQGHSKNAFCEDPAVIRARREARYQQRQPNRPRDVVGKAKGQGQEKTVIQNRDNKNTHKSSRANHNRRAGAQWKRNRGMMPS